MSTTTTQPTALPTISISVDEIARALVHRGLEPHRAVMAARAVYEHRRRMRERSPDEPVLVTRSDIAEAYMARGIPFDIAQCYADADMARLRGRARGGR